MTAMRVLREPLEELEFAIHRVCAHALLVINLLYASRLNRVIGEFAQPIVLGSAAAIMLFYCGYAILRGRFLLSILALCFVALVMHQIALFAGRLHIAVQPNVFFQFMWLLSFLPFCLLGKLLGVNYLLRCVVGYSTAYCFFYTFAALGQMAGVIPSGLLEAIISSDVERGARLFIYISMACFAYFYWLVQLREKITSDRLFFFLICAAASVLSLSRVYLLITFLLTIIFIVSQRPAWISIAARTMLVIGSAYVLSGMFHHSFNPFDQFAGDSSGSYRAMEYDIVRQRIWMDVFWGFGLSPNWEVTKTFLGEAKVFSSDLGPLGVWFDLGVLGLCLYYYLLWKCSEPIRHLPPSYGWPLLLTGSMMTAYGCISPMAMAASEGSTFTGLIIGLGLAARKFPPHLNRHAYSKTVNATG